MTVGGLIAAAAGIIQVLRRHTAVAGAVWCITITVTLVPHAADAVGRVGLIIIQLMTVGGLIAAKAGNIQAAAIAAVRVRGV